MIKNVFLPFVLSVAVCLCACMRVCMCVCVVVVFFCICLFVRNCQIFQLKPEIILASSLEEYSLFKKVICNAIQIFESIWLVDKTSTMNDTK